MRLKKNILATLLLTAFALFSIHIASAQLLVGQTQTNLKTITDTTAQNAHFGNTTVGQVVAIVVKTALGFLSIVFIILIVTAGFRWMTAQGNEEDITQAKDTIRTAIIGLIVVLGAYAITYFVFTYLPFTGGTGPQGVTGG